MEKKLHATAANETDWRNKLTKTRIGSVTLPVYLVTASIILVTALLEQLPVNMLGGFAVILTMGWLLGTIGGNIPILKHFGGPAILSLLVPSIMVFFNLLNQNVLDSTNILMKQANFLYFYIACLVCGSILGMNRKIFSPRFNAHDCPDGIRNDFSNGCWDPCWNAVRSRLET